VEKRRLIPLDINEGMLLLVLLCIFIYSIWVCIDFIGS
jgi:hypothetical protein